MWIAQDRSDIPEHDITVRPCGHQVASARVPFRYPHCVSVPIEAEYWNTCNKLLRTGCWRATHLGTAIMQHYCCCHASHSKRCGCHTTNQYLAASKFLRHFL